MIVAGPEGFIKSAYRKFAIRGPVAPGDDFAMMREVLHRRFGRLLREEGAQPVTAPPPKPLPQGEGELDTVPPPFVGLGCEADQGRGEEAAPGGDGPSRSHEWPDLVLIDGAWVSSRRRVACWPISASTDLPMVAHRQGPRPRCRTRMVSQRRWIEPFQLRRAIPCCISFSAYAMRRTFRHHHPSRRPLEER